MGIPKGTNVTELSERKKARLSAPDVRRWYDNVERGSPTTADTYLRGLYLFTDRMNTTPQALLKLKEKALYDLMLDFVGQEEKRGQAGHTTLNHTKAVRSWLSHHSIHIAQNIKVRHGQDTPTIRDERIPLQEELHRIFGGCVPAYRAAAALMAHSGLRPEVLGNYHGNDGLKLRDFPEMKIQGKSVEFETIPTLVVVRPELSKAGHRYFTFLGEEGCGFIRDYLAGRMNLYEELSPDTDLIHPRNEKKRFVRTINVSDGIRNGIRSVMGKGVKMRPYALRAYFDTQLLLAESKGKVAHDYRVFWMGHKGSMEARYTTNKGRLPKDLIDDMREAYRRCEPFLSTVPTKGAQETQASIAKVMLLGLGYAEEELADKDLLDPQVFQQMVKDKMVSAAPKQKQKLVEAQELPHYLEDGWTVVTAVNGHQVVLNPP